MPMHGASATPDAYWQQQPHTAHASLLATRPKKLDQYQSRLFPVVAGMKQSYSQLHRSIPDARDTLPEEFDEHRYHHRSRARSFT
jgi:hypothetical protein